jgi:hypothetical protein
MPGVAAQRSARLPTVKDVHKDARRGSPALEVEQALRVVPGVLEATVSVGEAEDTGTEVRLVLSDDGDEAAVAYAVHRMLRLQYGVGLDDDGVELVMDITDAAVSPLRSVGDDTVGDPTQSFDLGVQIDDLLSELDRRSGRSFDADVLSAAVRHPAGATVVPEPRGADAEEAGSTAGRLSIARLSIVLDHRRAQATVTLSSPDGVVRGSAESGSSDSAVLEAVALATLRAVASLHICEKSFAVTAVSVAHVGEVDVAVVQVECCQHIGSERLTGASEVRDDVHRAVVRATLDAVNRRLPLLTLGP